jgi:hypothetical protein
VVVPSITLPNGEVISADDATELHLWFGVTIIGVDHP